MSDAQEFMVWQRVLPLSCRIMIEHLAFLVDQTWRRNLVGVVTWWPHWAPEMGLDLKQLQKIHRHLASLTFIWFILILCISVPYRRSCRYSHCASMLLVQRGATSDFRHDCSAAALAILSHRDVSDLPRDALSLVLPCDRVRPVSFKSMEQGRQSVVLNWMSQEISNEATMDIDGQRFLVLRPTPRQEW